MATITDMQYYPVLFILCLISTLVLQFIFKKSTKSITHLHLPPSPPALPFIGHLHLLSPYVHKCFHNISSKYGPLLSLRFGFYQCLLVSSASIATEIFKTHDLNFATRPSSIFKESILVGDLGILNAPYGDYWRFLKKLCVTKLLSARQIERSRTVRREELLRFLHRLLEAAYKNEIVDVSGELVRLTNNATCRVVMSTRCSQENGDAERIRELVSGSFMLMTKMFLLNSLGPLKKLGHWVTGKELLDVTTTYDELLERILTEHEERAKRESGEREDTDLMDILLEVYQNDNAEVRITRTQVKAFILDLFLAGTNTTAETIEWTMAELINRSSVFKKAREEIESVVGRTRLVEESDIPSLPYLQAVVKETLRLHAPASFTIRECRKNCKIGGFDIPEKSIIAINLYSIMRDPDSWENPNEFYPERFLDSSKEQDNNDQDEMTGQNFNFVPFGGGRRRCPGSNLAFILVNTAIAAMVQCFDWKVPGDGDKVINMQGGIGLTLHRAHPLQCLPVVHFNPCVS